MNTSNDDPIGYGRPPKASQFRPGQSGNPRGRPKGSRNLTNLVEEELDRKILVKDGGQSQRVSKRQLAARQLANKAAQGDIKAFLAIARLLQATEHSQPPTPDGQALPNSELTDEQCQELLQRLFGQTPERED